MEGVDGGGGTRIAAAWQNISACSTVTRSPSLSPRVSCSLKQDTNNDVHKNLPTASPKSDYLTHTCAISCRFLSPYWGLSAGSISPNASLNSSIGLSYLFSLKHSSGQLFKFLPGLSKHFYFFLIFFFFFNFSFPEDTLPHSPFCHPTQKLTLSCVFAYDKRLFVLEKD